MGERFMFRCGRRGNEMLGGTRSRGDIRIGTSSPFSLSLTPHPSILIFLFFTWVGGAARAAADGGVQQRVQRWGIST